MKTISNPATLAALAARLESVTPVAERHWGTITPHQMVVHLGDAADAVLQRRPWPTSRRKESRLMKWLALSLPIKWPHGVKAGADPAGRVLAEGDFPVMAGVGPAPLEGLPPADPGAGRRPLGEIERATILQTLEAAGGNKSETARRLGITRRTLHKKLKAYGVMK